VEQTLGHNFKCIVREGKKIIERKTQLYLPVKLLLCWQFVKYLLKCREFPRCSWYQGVVGSTDTSSPRGNSHNSSYGWGSPVGEAMKQKASRKQNHYTAGARPSNLSRQNSGQSVFIFYSTDTRRNRSVIDLLNF